jgi:hypothetical protein
VLEQNQPGAGMVVITSRAFLLQWVYFGEDELNGIEFIQKIQTPKRYSFLPVQGCILLTVASVLCERSRVHFTHSFVGEIRLDIKLEE